MKVTYLHQYFATRNSITSTRSFELAKQMIKNGHKVTMVTTDAFIKNESPIKEYRNYSVFQIEGIKVIAQKNSYSNHMSYMRRIFSFLKFLIFSYRKMSQIPSEMIYATSTPLTIMIPTLLVHSIKKKSFVFEVRDLWPDAPVEMRILTFKPIIGILKKLEILSYQHAEHIIALSDGMKEGIVSKGVSSDKVTVAENLCDFDLFDIHNIDQQFKDELIKRYHLEDKFIILHMGAMGVANGLDYFIDAAKKAQLDRLDEVLFIIGGDGKTKQQLEKRCEKEQIKNVVFLGYIPRKLVPTVTSLADVTMTCFKNIPILATNSPNKFFDSLAAGKPVIVNSNGWTRQVVEKEKIGFYIDGDRPEELVERIKSVLRNSISLKEQESHIKRFARENYEVSVIYQKIENSCFSIKKVRELGNEN